jgi:DNA-binding NarL/FixJ family response regulator
MRVMNEAYITGTGAFLPGDPVDNEQLSARFAADTPRAVKLLSRTLAANGIKTRHYAVDDSGMTLMLNEELAAEAARRALADRGLGPHQVGMLATGTTQGDLLVPGFASMVHGRLGGGPMEVLSASGVCASGMAALKAAVSAVRLGEHQVAVAVGEQQDVLDAVKAGAVGYLLKSATRPELLDAVRRTADGEAVFTPGLAALVLGEFRRLSAAPAGAGRGVPRLSERETEILRMVATGLSYKQIATRLVLSHRTVQNHVQNTLGKLQLHNRVELVRYAIEHGLAGEFEAGEPAGS